MYIQEIVEVVIGLFFVFLLMSLATMTARETISGWFKWRSSMLKDAIVGLVSEQVRKPGFWESIRGMFSRKGVQIVESGTVSGFFSNPLITALHQPGGKPSYIPGRQFAKAVIDEVTREIETTLLDAAEDALQAVFKRIDSAIDQSQFNEILKNVLKRVNQSKLINETSRSELLDLIQDGGGSMISFETAAKAFFEKHPEASPAFQLQLGIEALKLKGEQHLANSLRHIIKDAEASFKHGEDYLNGVLTKTENWFDYTMDRLEGWYKRRTGRIALVVGLLLAFALNVDTFHIATSLWKEPALRQAIVAQAEQVKPEQLQAEFGAGSDITTQVRDFSNRLTDDLSLPVGWQFKGEDTLCIPAPKLLVPKAWENYTFGILTADGSCKRDLFTFGAKVFGIFLTGVAAAQNSSFWFDSLDKLINVRNAGKKPASSTKDEKPAS